MAKRPRKPPKKIATPVRITTMYVLISIQQSLPEQDASDVFCGLYRTVKEARDHIARIAADTHGLVFTQGEDANGHEMHSNEDWTITIVPSRHAEFRFS